MRLLLMGPPGAGKGTQAKVISSRLRIPAISTGDIFRANVSQETPLGREAKRYIETGEYVPDEITNNMVRVRLREDDAIHGFLLDGYPRTVAQVHELDAMLRDGDSALDAVVCLTVDDEELIQRLVKRAVTEGRTDDTEDVIRHRQGLYNTQTAPLLEVYQERRLLVEVDGTGPVDEVTERILGQLDAVRSSSGD